MLVLDWYVNYGKQLSTQTFQKFSKYLGVFYIVKLHKYNLDWSRLKLYIWIAQFNAVSILILGIYCQFNIFTYMYFLPGKKKERKIPFAINHFQREIGNPVMAQLTYKSKRILTRNFKRTALEPNVPVALLHFTLSSRLLTFKCCLDTNFNHAE